MEKWKQSIIPLFINFQKAFHTFISAFFNKVESIGNQNYLVTPHSCLSVKVRQLIVHAVVFAACNPCSVAVFHVFSSTNIS